MRTSHPMSLSHSQFHDTTLVLGLETSSFATTWCFGGHGGYSTTTASSVELDFCQISSRLALSIALLLRYPLPRACTNTARSYPDTHVLFLPPEPLATSGVRVVSRTFALCICYRIPTLCLEHISRRHLHISLYRCYCYKTCSVAPSNVLFSFTRTRRCPVNPPTPSSALVSSQLILMCAYTRSLSSSTSQHRPLVLRCANAHVVLRSMTTLSSTLII
ncbi:hypothetical protein M405DRAFT_286048 [Rhizopogon salebrosus TDB-379]|nr:hypothetical protein M405DRAFT_286048 [Rhizopogon salebrosus TDB-379]